ncbi:MAG: AAA family ATPase [Candidatus Anstonellales archaeon]
MLIALTGPVCSGKTFLAKKLKRKGIFVIHLNEWIKERRNLIIGYDRKLKAYIIDNEKVGKMLKEYIKEIEKKENKILVESHLLPDINIKFDIAIIIDTKPELLYKRMKARKYNKEKIEQNLIALHLDYFWIKTRAKKKIRFKPSYKKKDVDKIMAIIKKYKF